MFTGLIEDVGAIVDVRPEGNGRALAIRTALDLSASRLGDSFAIDGACLTAERYTDDGFVVVAAAETMALTTLKRLRPGSRVHIERALKLGDRLDGHLVQGHVDGVGTVVSAVQERESWVIWVDAPPAIARFVAAKGSIAIDGVSLTVNEVTGARFRVNIVPHTARQTRIAGFTPGMGVNLEVDVLARYVDRLLGGGEGLTAAKLAAHGFGSR